MELSMSSIMAKKQTGLSNRPYVATLFLFFVVILLACTKGKEEPSASVPADCQQFLAKYFDAWKSKDIATLQALSFYLSPEDRSRLPEGSLEIWREWKNKLVTENFEQVTRDFGDFKGYEVLRMKTTTISPQDQPAANTIGSGIHTELVCKDRLSKKHVAHVGLHLIKEQKARSTLSRPGISKQSHEVRVPRWEHETWHSSFRYRLVGYQRIRRIRWIHWYSMWF